ncbi:hypothetical protein [Limnovirga soli]|uniref:Uncharacterized protein n=1 Tax=Limnovirga soli TaxID=2656915 RepID=A0A8J8FBJ7_9BACT|nr:hypothetical protein [Limnovirga soli]NNV54537.1 hypothetical protein [Limnovirga soli]
MSELKDAIQRWQEHCKYVQEMTAVNTALNRIASEKRKALAKKDYQYFTSEYFPHYCFDKETGKPILNADFHNDFAYKVKRDKNFFGVAEWPREHAKSVHCTIILPLWLYINGELDGLILTSKSQDAAIRLLSDIQAELQYNQRLIEDFGEMYNEGSWELGNFVTNQNVFFIALGRGQSPRGIRYKGKRPNMGISDDIDDDEIVNNQSRVIKVVEWLLGAFYGALDIRQSRFIMVGNRFHPKQVLAHIVGDVEEGDPKRKGLHHSLVYATTDGTLEGNPTWHQKFTKEALHRRFNLIGSIMALREYFHKYVIKGKRFKAEWIQWDKVPALKEMDCMVVYFDPSYKSSTSNDYKAIRFWGRKGIKRYLIDAYVRQTTITQAVKWMYDLYESIPSELRANIDWWMEDVFLQDQFFQDFEEEAELRGYYLPIRGDKRQKPEKFARIEAMTPMYERGHVIWNEAKRKSPDMQTGYLQYMGFEKGSPINDDAPDADEGANEKMNKKTFKQKFKPMLGYDENPNRW